MALPPFLLEFLQALAAGVMVGGAYALMCIGLGIIFGSMRVINFAQGDFLMLGMYVAFYLTTGYGILAFLGPMRGRSSLRFSRGPWFLHSTGSWLVSSSLPPPASGPLPRTRPRL